MTYKNLEIVVLNHDIPEYRLKEGDTGTVVDVYEDGNTYEVEFMTAKGKTIAVLTLNFTEISPKVKINLKSQKSEKSDRSFQPSTIGNLPFSLDYHSNTYNTYS